MTRTPTKKINRYCFCEGYRPPTQVLQLPKSYCSTLRKYALYDTKKVAVAIDDCLVEEIKYLWERGIITVSCCCGHNERLLQPYIAVIPPHIDKMEKLGYRHIFNPFDPDCNEFFHPKSVVFTKYDFFRELKWKLKHKFTSLIHKFIRS